MQCPDCEYVLSPFDKTCPRCAEFKAKGIPKNLPAAKTPPSNQDQLPAAKVHEPTHVDPPRPLRVLNPGYAESLSSPPAAQSPVAQEPAPLIIYTNRVVRWKPWAALAAAIVLCVAIVVIWQAHQAALTKAIVDAARDGACQRMPGFDTDREQKGCFQLAGALSYTVKQDASDHADVTFYLNGISNSLAVSVNRDQDGAWHAVSAKEGDEGSRREYDRNAVPVWVPRDSPPEDHIGGPVVPPPDPAPAAPSMSAPAGPAGPSGPADPSSNGSGITMRTEAGGGPPPDPTALPH